MNHTKKFLTPAVPEPLSPSLKTGLYRYRTSSGYKPDGDRKFRSPAYDDFLNTWVFAVETNLSRKVDDALVRTIREAQKDLCTKDPDRTCSHIVWWVL